MEYAIKNGISLSTLRRHIKANKVTHKIEKGRYLLLDQAFAVASVPVQDATVNRLTAELQRAYEEIAELKTLIALYEEKVPYQRSI